MRSGTVRIHPRVSERYIVTVGQRKTRDIVLRFVCNVYRVRISRVYENIHFREENKNENEREIWKRCCVCSRHTHAHTHAAPHYTPMTMTNNKKRNSKFEKKEQEEAVVRSECVRIFIYNFASIDNIDENTCVMVCGQASPSTASPFQLLRSVAGHATHTTKYVEKIVIIFSHCRACTRPDLIRFLGGIWLLLLQKTMKTMTTMKTVRDSDYDWGNDRRWAACDCDE